MKPSTFRTLFCPLFEHQKTTDVCTVLRAKKVCKHQCREYFAWAQDNKEFIQATLDKYDYQIKAHLKREGSKEPKELITNVLPAGDHVCHHCGKPFKHEGKLQWHLKKKHRRLEVATQETSIRGATKKPVTPFTRSSSGITKTGTSPSSKMKTMREEFLKHRSSTGKSAISS